MNTKCKQCGTVYVYQVTNHCGGCGRIDCAVCRMCIALATSHSWYCDECREKNYAKMGSHAPPSPSEYQEMCDKQVRELKDKAKRLDAMRDLAECPPDCTLEHWIKVLVNAWHRYIKLEDKAERFDAMVAEYAKAKGEASRLRNRLDAVTKVLQYQQSVAERDRRDTTTRGDLDLASTYSDLTRRLKGLLKVAKGESDE